MTLRQALKQVIRPFALGYIAGCVLVVPQLGTHRYWIFVGSLAMVALHVRDLVKAKTGDKVPDSSAPADVLKCPTCGAIATVNNPAPCNCPWTPSS